MLNRDGEELEILEERTVRRFAWLPERLDDGRWIHLAWYEERDVCIPDDGALTQGIWLRVSARALPD